jgi:hypothetical protein
LQWCLKNASSGEGASHCWSPTGGIPFADRLSSSLQKPQAGDRFWDFFGDLFSSTELLQGWEYNFTLLFCPSLVIVAQILSVIAHTRWKINFLKQGTFFSKKIFVILLYWGYIVAFIKVLTIHHSWITPSIILLYRLSPIHKELFFFDIWSSMMPVGTFLCFRFWSLNKDEVFIYFIFFWFNKCLWLFLPS